MPPGVLRYTMRDPSGESAMPGPVGERNGAPWGVVNTNRVGRATGTGGVRRTKSADRTPATSAPRTHGSARRHTGRMGGGTIDVVTTGAARLADFSKTNRTVEMSATRCRRSFTRQLCNSVRIAGGTSDGRASHDGSSRTTAPSTSVMSSPSNAPCARQHLVQHAAERPDVTPLVRRAAPSLARDSYRQPCRGSSQPASSRAW